MYKVQIQSVSCRVAKFNNYVFIILHDDLLMLLIYRIAYFGLIWSVYTTTGNMYLNNRMPNFQFTLKMYKPYAVYDFM